MTAATVITLAVIMNIVVPTGAGAVVPPPTTIVAIADSYANQGAPSANFGTSTSLASVGGTASISYLRFALPATPVDAALKTATLSLKTTTLGSAASTGQHVVREGADGWTESTLTWNTRPAVPDTALASFSAPTVNAAVSVPLNVAGVAPHAGRQMTLTLSSASADSAWFWSREFGTTSARPSLILTYATVASATPTPTPTPSPSPTVSTGPRVVKNLAFGDSIVEGCCGTTNNGTFTGKSISEVWSTALGWQTPVISGWGGTGYLTGGPVSGRLPYTAKIGPVLDANPNLDILIIEGGGNDPENDLVAFRDAVATTFAIARAKEPTAKIFVLGPYSPTGGGYAGKRAVIAEEAVRAGFPYIDQIDQQWMKGRSDLLWTDGFHPNAAGHAMLGRRTAGELALLGAPVIR